MVVVVVVVLAGFEAFKQLAKLLTGWISICVTSAQPAIFREISVWAQQPHKGLSYLPPRSSNWIWKQIRFFTLSKVVPYFGVTTKDWLDNSWPAEESKIECNQNHIHDVCQSESDFIKLRQTRLGSKSELLTSPLSSIGKIASPQFWLQQDDIDTMTDISVISDLLHFLVTSDITQHSKASGHAI